MELPKKAAKLFADNAKLQKMTYNMMVEICKGHGGKFRFSSDLCIDLDYGVIGVTTCNLKGMYLKDDYLLVESTTTDGGCSKDVHVLNKQSLEILEIL